MPASILVGASFNPQLARAGGGVLGREARIRGFNAVLAGGINLARDIHNGRNYEYYSEDPLVSAVLGAEAVNGIQAEGVISTLKHYTLNCNETNRHWLDAIIDPAAHRESDLLAFQIAIERSHPGAIMSRPGPQEGGSRRPPSAPGRPPGRRRGCRPRPAHCRGRAAAPAPRPDAAR
jgi:beta-glucosidase